MGPMANTKWGMPRAAGRPRAFSLAELMIALAILGFGLAVIGAAVPVGLRYTRESIEQGNGLAAAEYGLDLAEQRVRTSRSGNRDNLFHPRENRDVDGDGVQETGALAVDPAAPNRAYEPLIKVRPLSNWAVDPALMASWPTGQAPRPWPPGNVIDTSYMVESRILAWFQAIGAVFDAREIDPIALTSNPPWRCQPALAPLESLYPPTPLDGLQLSNLPQEFDTRIDTMYTPTVNGRILRQRIAMVSFYRAMPTGALNQYELICVATALGEGQRFHVQEPDRPLGTPGPYIPLGSGGRDSQTPVPWLITFAQLPPPQPYDPADPTRTPSAAANELNTLRFRLVDADAGLLPPGSIFIPAVNDVAPSHPSLAGAAVAGFMPAAPAQLPIFEVVGNPDRVTVEVRNNGAYPWTIEMNVGQPANPLRWPVWVIPPAHAQVDQNQNPVFERRSPVLAYSRRVVTLSQTE